MNYVIIYATVDGQSKKIAKKIQENIQQTDNQVTICPIEEADHLELSAFDKIIIGASIRYGHFSKKCFRFIHANLAILQSKPSYFFGVNLIARDKNKTVIENNVYVRKFFEKISWKPEDLAIFAGKLDYPNYGAVDKYLIRFIMKITGGETDTSKSIEYTDWESVAKFADRLVK